MMPLQTTDTSHRVRVQGVLQCRVQAHTRSIGHMLVYETDYTLLTAVDECSARVFFKYQLVHTLHHRAPVRHVLVELEVGYGWDILKV